MSIVYLGLLQEPNIKQHSLPQYLKEKTNKDLHKPLTRPHRAKGLHRRPNWQTCGREWTGRAPQSGDAGLGPGACRFHVKVTCPQNPRFYRIL